MSLEAIPPEISWLIADQLASTDPVSLGALALVNKSCFATCLPLIQTIIYHDVRVNLRRDLREKPSEVDGRARKVLDILRQTAGIQYVRRLILDEHACHSCMLQDPEWHPPKLKHIRRGEADRPCASLYGNMNHPHEHRSRPDWSIDLFQDSSFSYGDDVDWNSMIDLMKGLPGLQDFFYLSHRELPPPILEFLHESQRGCRLHLHSFSLQSLLLSIPTSLPSHRFKLSPFERSLVRSPSLYSAVLKHEDIQLYFHECESIHQKIGILHTLREAPNLKELYIERTNIHDPTESFTRPLPFPTHDDLQTSNSRIGSLTKLQIADWKSIRPQELLELEGYTDFCKLQTLRLHSQIGIDFKLKQNIFKIWEKRRPFKALQNLKLNLGGCNRLPKFYASARRFLRSLPSLKELILEGWHSIISVESIMKTHSSTLVKLQLTYQYRSHSCCLTESDIKLLVNSCYRLEDLTCKVQRTGGDLAEVALYEALGAIKRLKHLSLGLAVSDPALFGDEEWNGIVMAPTRLSPLQEYLPCDFPIYESLPSDPTFDDFDSQLCKWNLQEDYRARNGHVRRFMINSALDKKLVCAIFHKIASAKTDYCLPLEEMAVYIDEPERVRIFTSSWRVERGSQYTSCPGTRAWETNLTDTTIDKRLDPLTPEMEDIFKRIWPDKTAEYNQSMSETQEPRTKSVRRPWMGKAGSSRSRAQLSRKSDSNEIAREGLDCDWWAKWSSFPLADD